MTSEFRTMLLALLPQMRGYAMAMTRNRSQADDLLQQTAVKAIHAEHQFEVGTNFKAWMYRILRNEFLSSRRRARNFVPLDEIPAEVGARDGGQEDKVMTREVLLALNKLPLAQREVMIMTCVGQMSYEEVAETLQCSIGTVKSRMWRARAEIQRMLLGPSVEGPTKSDKVSEHRARETRQITEDFVSPQSLSS